MQCMIVHITSEIENILQFIQPANHWERSWDSHQRDELLDTRRPSKVWHPWSNPKCK